MLYVGERIFLKKDSAKSKQGCCPVKVNTDEAFMKYISPRSTAYVGTCLRQSSF